MALNIQFSAEQIFPVPTTAATATASFTIDQTSGAAGGDVTLNGVAATDVTINTGFAGNTGAAVVTLMQSGSNANVWSIPAGTTLTAQQYSDLTNGKLYVLVASAANPAGELRAQLIPNGISVVFAEMGGDREPTTVVTGATGMAAVTVNNAASTAAVNVNTSIASPVGVELRYTSVSSTASADDTLIAALVADNAVAGHWLNENIALSVADTTNFTGSRWWVNVFTAAHTGGEIAGRFAVNPPTLTALQANIFTPACSGCHTGVGAVLPGSQNLTTKADTYANVVGIDSVELSSLKRVRRYDPDNSYLVRKIEGVGMAAGTARMPANGNFLSQAQIDQVRAWVAAGAPNN